MATNLSAVLRSMGGRKPSKDFLEQAKAINEEAKANWGERGWHREQAALIAQAVDLGFQNEVVFNGVLDFQNLQRGDKLTHKTRRGIKVYAIASGGYVEESTISWDGFEASHSPLAWHVVASEDDVLADYATNLVTMVDLARQAEEAEIIRRQLALLQAAVPTGSASYVDATGTGLTSAVLKAAISDVADAPMPSGITNPTAITVIGRYGAVDPINDFSGFSQRMLDEVNDSGFLGHWRGARIQRVNNYADGDGNAFFPANEVWVVRSGAGKFARFGEARVKNYVEDNFDKVHWKSRRETGGLVAYPEVVRRIVTS